jgi:hypothetical protein
MLTPSTTNFTSLQSKFSADFLFATSVPTVCVTGGWLRTKLGNGKALKFRKSLKKRAAYQPSGARIVGGRLGTHDSAPEQRLHRQVDKIIACANALFN